jgi:hypothetical protein
MTAVFALNATGSPVAQLRTSCVACGGRSGMSVHPVDLRVSGRRIRATRYRRALHRNGNVGTTLNLALAPGQSRRRAIQHAIAAKFRNLPDLSRGYELFIADSEKALGS